MSHFSLIVVASSVAAFTLTAGGYKMASRVALTPACNIKGNISINSGAHIFHVPGQLDYDSTIIRPEYGERWFCSESDARAAGWHKASR